MDNTLLQRLLDDAGAHDPEYGNGLSNHLPMAWLALARLGAGEARLREFGTDYIAGKRLRPARPREPGLGPESWTGSLGEREAWPRHLDFFEHWIAREGVAVVLAQALPVLLPGVAAAAFHGLIRTAAGVQAGHGGEVAQGLAHWAAWYMPLGPHGPPGPPAATEAAASARPRARARPDAGPPDRTDDPAALLRELPAGTSSAGLIAARMRDAAADGAVSAVAARLLIDDHTPARLARAAALAYAETGNFTALHLVTGTHAMRVLAPFVADEPGARHAAWRSFWPAYAHGVVAARLAPARAPLVLRAWPALIAAALRSPDEHLIKLVDAAREETRHYGGEDWQRAASRAVMAAT
ncbi:MAG: DUF4243 domain-containing protein [Burkholderiales bacterium]|nr:DUF4243 domain-containing protein [Burkholderiales bacterium]